MHKIFIAMCHANSILTPARFLRAFLEFSDQQLNVNKTLAALKDEARFLHRISLALLLLASPLVSRQ